MSRPRLPTPLRWAVGPLLVAGLVVLAGPGELLQRLGRLDPVWAAAALAMTVPATLVSAWRWHYTARRVGLPLPVGRAVAEYWLSTFLNQVLPGGVAGDVGRAWRDGALRERSWARGRGRAWRVVVMERASGQAVVGLVAAVSVLLLLPELPAQLRGRLGWVAAGVAALLLAGWALRRRLRGGGVGRLRRLVGAEVQRALLAPPALAVQLATSTAAAACYLAIFVLGARAVGVETPLGSLLPLVMPVLLAMLVPVSVAGWGVREGAAAGLWGLVGLPVADGVAASLAYGVVVLAGSLPGALILLRRRPLSGAPAPGPEAGRRGPRPGRPPARSDASEA